MMLAWEKVSKFLLVPLKRRISKLVGENMILSVAKIDYSAIASSVHGYFSFSLQVVALEHPLNPKS